MHRKPFLLSALFLAALCSCTTNPSPAVWTPFSPINPTNPSPETIQLPTPLAQADPLPTDTPAPLILPEADSGRTNPLTGLDVEDITRLERRPVMVKISNYPRTGRPHAGLSLADIVFEYYIGFGFNRFLSIYLGADAEMAGPVRSGRYVDRQLGELYKGLLFFGNADKRVEDALFEELGPRALAEKNVPSPPKIRLPEAEPEISLFVDTAKLSQYYTLNDIGVNERVDLSGLAFSNQIPTAGMPGKYLGVQFSRQARGEWRFDPSQGVYLRWIETGPGEAGGPIPMTPLVDRTNDRQIAIQNVILVFATYEEFNPTLHDIHLFDQIDGKRAVIFRDGTAVDAVWKTTNNSHPLQFFYQDGAIFPLKPGKSWIILVGDSSTLTTGEEGGWELRFDIP